MDFDFNLILVPLTLVLGVIWLLDKLVLKQHGGHQKHIKEYEQAKGALKRHETALIASLKSHHIENVDTDNLNRLDKGKLPLETQSIYDEYLAAKSYLNIASTKTISQKENFFIRLAYDFFPILAVVLVVRSFLFEPFNIPSSSMVPTLYTGDFIAVNKFAYGLRLPLTYNKVFDTGHPEHGDVMVFRFPENPNIYYIKRVIGLPGDTVSYDNGILAINGQQVDTKPANYSPDAVLTSQIVPAGITGNGETITSEQAAQFGREEESHAKYYQEQQGNHQHLVRYLEGFNSSQYGPFLQSQSPEVVASAGTHWQIKVPENEYFVMGDNRDRSADGRYWGFVPDDNLAGKAVYVWMHKAPGLKLPSFYRNGPIQ